MFRLSIEFNRLHQRSWRVTFAEMAKTYLVMQHLEPSAAELSFSALHLRADLTAARRSHCALPKSSGYWELNLDRLAAHPWERSHQFSAWPLPFWEPAFHTPSKLLILCSVILLNLQKCLQFLHSFCIAGASPGPMQSSTASPLIQISATTSRGTDSSTLQEFRSQQQQKMASHKAAKQKDFVCRPVRDTGAPKIPEISKPPGRYPGCTGEKLPGRRKLQAWQPAI